MTELEELRDIVQALAERVKALEEAVAALKAQMDLGKVFWQTFTGTTGEPPPPRETGLDVAPFPYGVEGD